jgi:hypothetical protein
METNGDKVALLLAWKLEHDRYTRNFERVRLHTAELVQLVMAKRKLSKIAMSRKMQCSQNRLNEYIAGEPMSALHLARLAALADTAPIRNTA